MIVLDASAWIDVLTAGARLGDLADAQVVVPPHFDAEVVGAVRGLAQRSLLTGAAADTAIDRHLRAPFARDFATEDLLGAWRLREQMSVADAWYAALARRLGATWATSDTRAAQTARRLGVSVTVL